MQSNQVSLKGRPNLALEDLAGHRLEWNLFRLLALELSLVPIVHLLNDKRDPTNRRLGEAKLQFGMSLQCSEVEKIDKGIEKRSRAVAEPHIESHLALIRLECLRRSSDGSRLKAAADVVRHDDVGLLGGIPEHIPRFEVHTDRYIVYQEVCFAKTQFCYPSDLLLGGFCVNWREHGNWKESLRGGLGELRRPVVVGLNASIPQFRLAHLHGKNRRKHERRLDAVAIHISKTFVRRGRSSRFADAASVQSKWVSLGSGKPPLATIITPGLAIANPEFTLVAPVLDMRASIPQKLGQAFGPQILGQIT